MNSSPTSVSLSAIERYSSVIEQLTSTAQRTTHLAALSLRCQAAFIALISNRGIKIIGAYGLNAQSSKLEHLQIPDWLIPTQARQFLEHRVLQQIAEFTQSTTYKNAYATAITMPEGNIGALWLLGAPPEPLHTLAVQRELIIGFADQIAQHLLVLAQYKHNPAKPRENSFVQHDLAISVAQAVQEGVMLTDQNGVVEFVNTYVETLLAAPAKDFIGRSLTEFVRAENQAQIIQIIFALAKGQAVTLQLVLLRQDGLECLVRYHAQPRRDHNGIVVGAITSIKDLTAEIETKQQLQTLESELGRFKIEIQNNTGFSGRLENIGGAVGLMQMLTVSPVNGVLNLDDSMIFFEHGKIVAIEHPRLQGKTAAEAIIGRQRGQFQFIPEVSAATANLNIDPTTLALTHLKNQDEQRKKIPEKRVVRLKNSQAAKAFFAGVGGHQLFEASLEAGQIVFRGQNMIIEVEHADLLDFLEP